MAASTAFMNTCNGLIAALPSYIAFQAALATYEAANDEAKASAWHAVYGENQAGGSLAIRLRRAIRDIVTANAGSTESTLDREDAYRRLAAPFATRYEDRPLTQEQEIAARVPLVQLAALND